jgi:hypothetical protein
MTTVVMPEGPPKPIRVIEVCLGCGAKRKVDIDPQWERFPVRPDPTIDQAAREAVGFARDNNKKTVELGFCDNCAPHVKKQLGKRGYLYHMKDLRRAMGRRWKRKQCWLDTQTGGKEKTVMAAAMKLRSDG